jgi:hypothetical protein
VRAEGRCIVNGRLTVVELLRYLLAAVLVGTAAAKLVGGAGARAALRSYGLADPRIRAAAWALVIAAELVLAGAVAAGMPWAPAGAAVLLGLFALALVTALARGRAGAPCGCLGTRSRITPAAAARAAALTAAFAALPWLPDTRPSTQTWLGVGIAVSLAGVALLAVGLLALAREVGELRLAVAPQAALSLAHEGPELGSRTALSRRFGEGGRLRLAVFTSPGCPLCEALGPAVRLVGTDPAVDVRLFDEREDPDVWEELAVPGGPYGVVLDADGTVLSKGTFNTLLQLEGLLAAAERRQPEPAHA